jgi:DNA-binding transcriptional ArsR family regulator
MRRKENKPQEHRNSHLELALLSREAAELLKALSHETRLAIVCLVATEEKTVTEIQEALQAPQATISQQLGRLRRQQVIIGHRRGRTVSYSANSERLSPLIEALHSVFNRPA